MFQKVFATTVVLLAVLTSGAVAQGEFLRDGESGVKFGGTFMFGRDVGGGGTTIGASLGQNLDIAASFRFNTDAETKSVSPFVTYYIKHGGDNSVFGVALMTGFMAAEHTNYNRSQNYVLLGVAVFNNFYLTPQFVIQPYLSNTFGILTDDAWERTQANLAIGLSFGFAQRESVRPYLDIAGVLPDSPGDGYGTVSGGLVIAW